MALHVILLALMLTFAPTLASSQTLGVGPPSVLPQCLGLGSTTTGVGTSARLKKCTRQFCAESEYQAKVAAYEKSQPQSESDKKIALTCITRREQDQRKE
jgi:hypothetical protein